MTQRSWSRLLTGDAATASLSDLEAARGKNANYQMGALVALLRELKDAAG